PKVPRDLETVCLQCLRKEPGKRYGSARDLADDLANFLQGRAVRARPTAFWERGWRWCRRNPAVAAMTATVAALLLPIAVGAPLMSLRLRSALAQSDVDRDQARRDRDLARAAEEDGLRQLFLSYEAQARSERSSRRIGQRFKSLEAVEKALAVARRLGLP